jgi:hypothetical protein
MLQTVYVEPVPSVQSLAPVGKVKHKQNLATCTYLRCTSWHALSTISVKKSPCISYYHGVAALCNCSALSVL